MKTVTIVTGIFLMMFTHQELQAQQQMENTMSQYFRNRMLWNPAFTGADGNKFYALQNRSWVGFDGAPVMTNISGELTFGKNSAGGLQIISDVTGALYRTYGLFNYGYRIKLNEEQQLRLGISLALSSDRLNYSQIGQAGAIDPVIAENMNQQVKYDGNFGLVYSYKKFTFGASFFRLGENLNNSKQGNANLAFMQIGGSMDIDFNDDGKLQLKPLLMFHFYKATEAVADFGAQFSYNKSINTMLLYQSTGNIRAGAGLQLKDKGEANFFYNTNTKIANSASQQYELGIGIYLKGRKG